MSAAARLWRRITLPQLQGCWMLPLHYHIPFPPPFSTAVAKVPPRSVAFVREKKPIQVISSRLKNIIRLLAERKPMPANKIASITGLKTLRDYDFSGVSECIHDLCKHGRQKEAMHFLDCLEMFDDKVSYNSYVSALQVCSKLKALECGKFVHSLILDQGLKPDLLLGFHLVEFYVLCGCVHDARDIFDQLHDRDVKTWNSLIMGYAKIGRGKSALKLFSQMQQQGIAANEFTFVGLLKSCANLSALEQGKQVHAQIIKQGLESHPIVANTLTDMYSKCGNLLIAREVFDNMSSKNVVSWNAMIGGYAKGGQEQKALELFEKMKSEGMKPNEVTYVSVLNACASLSDLETGKKAHSQVLVNRFETNIFVGSAVIDMYAKCGRIRDARKVFDDMPTKNVVSWTSMIMAHVKEGQSQEALSLHHQMQRHGIKANAYTYVSLLNACASLSILEEGKHIHDQICTREFESNLFLGSALVDMYAKCGSIADARTVFDKMLTKDVVTWNAIIGGYAKHGQVNEAFKLFEQMQKAQLKPNEITFTGLLSSSATLYSLEQVKWVHSQILQRGVELSIFLASALIDLYTEQGCIQDARTLFNSIPAKDLVLWNSMISGYVKEDLGKEVFELFQQMQTEGMVPNEVTFVGLLNASASLLSLKQGSWVHSQVLENHFESNIFVASALVDMYSKCGSLEAAHEVFDRMTLRDSVTWSAMIAGYALHGQGLKALQLFEQMQHEGMQLENLNLACLFSACSHAGLLNEGLHYFDSLNRVSYFRFTVEHYGSIIDLLSRAGQLKDAVDFIISMPVQPTVTMWMALLGACRTYHDVEVAEKVLKHVLWLDPNYAPAYVQLSNIYAASGKVEHVEKVRECMRIRGIQKEPGCSQIEVNGVVHTFISEDKSHPEIGKIHLELKKLTIMMNAAGYVPNHSSMSLAGEEIGNHSEKLAIAFGLISTLDGTPIHIMKNLRVCSDCHQVTKFISKIVGRVVVVRDANRFHHFKNGVCSCGDYW